jgi:hypothetical protein
MEPGAAAQPVLAEAVLEGAAETVVKALPS